MLKPEILREYGRLLIEEGLITIDDIRYALEKDENANRDIADVILMSDPVSYEELCQFLGKRSLVPKLNDCALISRSEELVALVSAEDATRLKIVPVAKLGDILIVASEDLMNFTAVNELRNTRGIRVKLIQLKEGLFPAAHRSMYGGVVEAPREVTPPPSEPPPAVEEPVPPVLEPAPAPVEAIAATVVSHDELLSIEWSLNLHVVKEWQSIYADSAPIDAIKIT